MDIIAVIKPHLLNVAVTAALTVAGIFVVKLAAKIFSFFFLNIKKQCWFCHTLVKIKRSDQHQFKCPSCGQYNGFAKDGNYNREIPEMYDASLNPQTFAFKQDSSTHTVNGLCYSCNRNQELKLYQLASFVPVNEKDYERELDEFRTRLESTYRLCVFCEVTLREKLQLQDQWLRKNLPKGDSPKQPEKKSLELPTLKKSLKFILIAPNSLKLLFLSSAVVGIVMASVDLPCFGFCQFLDDVLLLAWMDAVHDNLLLLSAFGLLSTSGCLGVASWKHQLYKTDVFLLVLWLLVLGSSLVGYTDFHLSCTKTSYMMSATSLVIALVSVHAAVANRNVLIRRELTPKRLAADSDSPFEGSSGKRFKPGSTTETAISSKPFPAVSTFSAARQNRKRSPSSSPASLSPSDSVSQSGGRVRERFGDNFPKPVKLFEGLDECSIDTGISCLKIGSPHKRNQYFVPKPTNFLNRTGSTVSRSMFSSTKPVLSPPKFRPTSKTNFWFGSITQNKEYQDFNDYHKFGSSQPVSRSSSQSSGFVSCSDFNERTLVPEYSPPSPSLSRRSSVSDLTDTFREPEGRSRAGSVTSRCSMSRSLVLAGDTREVGRISRLSDLSQSEKTVTWSWLPFVLGFSVAINVCAAFYVLVLT